MENSKYTTDSRVLAKELGKYHSSICLSIRTLLKKYPSLGGEAKHYDLGYNNKYYLISEVMREKLQPTYTIENPDPLKYIHDSRGLAEEMGRRHSHLLASISTLLEKDLSLIGEAKHYVLGPSNKYYLISDKIKEMLQPGYVDTSLCIPLHGDFVLTSREFASKLNRKHASILYAIKEMLLRDTYLEKEVLLTNYIYSINLKGTKYNPQFLLTQKFVDYCTTKFRDGLLSSSLEGQYLNELDKVVPNIKRQVKISRYRVDGLVERYRLVIEIDEKYHLSKKQKAKDQKRQEILEKLGYTVLRVREGHLHEDMQEILYFFKCREIAATVSYLKDL